MGQPITDLPDPLESPATADGMSADDLLSKLAGDEIDRMLAEADAGESAPEPAIVSAPAHTPPPVPAETSPANESPSATAVDLDAVLNTAEAERAALQEHPVLPETHAAPIDLGESAERRRKVPFFLKPLVWISAPLDPWPDQLREMLGKIGIMTLVNAAAVIAYVLLFRRHHP